MDVDFKWKNKKRKAPPPPNPFTGEVEQLPAEDSSVIEDGEDMSAQDMIDFSPVYRCLHIHTVLVSSLMTSGLVKGIS